LVTPDVDFLRFAAEGIHHSGIVFGIQSNHSMGDWVKKLGRVQNIGNSLYK
jgi:hypothetical protein